MNFHRVSVSFFTFLSFLLISFRAEAGQLFDGLAQLFDRAEPASISELGRGDIWSCVAVAPNDKQFKIPGAFWVTAVESDPWLPVRNTRYFVSGPIAGVGKLQDTATGAITGADSNGLHFKKVANYLLIGFTTNQSDGWQSPKKLNRRFIFSCPNNHRILATEVKTYIEKYESDADVEQSDKAFLETYSKQSKQALRVSAFLKDGRILAYQDDLKFYGLSSWSQANNTFARYLRHESPISYEAVGLFRRDELYTKHDSDCRHGVCINDAVSVKDAPGFKVRGFFGGLIEVQGSGFRNSLAESADVKKQ